jgi:hypothetical protein
MNKLRNLATSQDSFSRPTPKRLLERVAGLAFNFSSVKLYPQSPADDPASLPTPLPGLQHLSEKSV